MFTSASSKLIGSASLKMKEIPKIKHIDEFEISPKCIEIFKNGQPQGKLLMTLCLLKTINKNNQPVEDIFNKKLCVNRHIFKFKISCLGLRNLSTSLPDPTIVFSVDSPHFRQVFGSSEHADENSGRDPKVH